MKESSNEIWVLPFSRCDLRKYNFYSFLPYSIYPNIHILTKNFRGHVDNGWDRILCLHAIDSFYKTYYMGFAHFMLVYVLNCTCFIMLTIEDKKQMYHLLFYTLESEIFI